MKNYARIVDGIVAEKILLEDDLRIEDVFHPDLVATIFPATENVAEGWAFDGNDFHQPQPVDELVEMKTRLKAAIDTAAEVERLRYITAGAGQALTYLQKSEEARLFLAAVAPNAGDYPLLSAEVGITASDIHGVATVVLAAYNQWQQVGAAIESIRLGVKAAVDAAESTEDAQASYDAIVWPSGQA